MRILLSLLVSLLLCTCAPSPKTGTIVAAGTVRYQAGEQTLRANLALSRTDSTLQLGVPTLYGSVMDPLVQDKTGQQFQAYRPMEFPGSVRFSLPAGNGKSETVEFPLAAPFIDSVPPVMSRANSQNFPVATSGLNDNENLVLFFEPKVAGSDPRRILVQGPTSTGNVSLPRHVLADIAPGDYQFYLIKQKLYRDSLPQLKVSLQAEYFSPTVSLRVTE
ncbi:hypothetical protein [Lewinella sp. W8]|uniref:hypothetical protein n=1 Tax=Lewinella sp. W8 TaxID=2528208 RepID=UPI0010674D08|nr:hypothetical protein [Lewinella sp. W8]MTB52894.1 hypothetical protein [Lewinella sp. W8]